MLILDTNHTQEISRGSPAGIRLLNRLRESGDSVATTIISAEEHLRGWMTEIRKRSKPEDQVEPYRRMLTTMEFYSAWLVLPWDFEAAALFSLHRAGGVRIGSMDLKIACIALAHEAIVLTRNRVDFSQVPGLRYENWLD
ncbi:MAG: type II toxin-antitoxin system VapC family toxin [Verrucomicrobiaceae bacterium]|nr:type II toxin-antitoxin system VapC family toxin [Verrucomicrobiaceae bacterium]